MVQSFRERRHLKDLLTIKRLAFGFLFLSVLNTFSNLFLSELNIFRTAMLKRSSLRMEELIVMETRKNEEFNKIYQKVKSNPKFYREKFIREYLLMFKEGERVVPLPEEMWYE